MDRILRDRGIRLRHLPGEVCLAERAASTPPVEPTESLLTAIGRCLTGDLRGLTILRARRAGVGCSEPCPDCGRPAETALLDVALGEHAGLALQDLPGLWCWDCGTGVLKEAQSHLRARLAGFDPGAVGELVPSLVYDTPSHPRSVQFEITTRCNLVCPYCSHRRLPDKSHLSLRRFRDFVDRIDLEHVDNVDFTGLGEPLLNAALPLMIREIVQRSNPTDVRVVTNGTALTPKVFAPLCEAGINSIAVSIDSLDAHRFARTRVGARLESVLKNLEWLVEFRRREGLDRLRIKIKAVLIDDRYQEAERLLRYSAQLGLEMPHFSCLDVRRNATKGYEEPWLHGDWGDAEGAAFQSWACVRWAELTSRSESAGATETAKPVSPAERASGFLSPAILPPAGLCRWAVDSTFVTVEGELLSCCETMIDVPRRPLASLDAASMAELWAGDLLWSYRLPLSLGLLPRGCVGCAQAPVGGVPLDEATVESPGAST